MSSPVPALIVIDMQNDFVTGSLAVPGGATIVDNINTLIDLPGFKTRIASKDFHPANHVSFANTHGKEVLSKLTIFHPDDADKANGIEQVLWPVHCVAGTNGSEFVPGLQTHRFDAVIEKGVSPGIESYSAFEDIWGKNKTELDGILKRNGVTDVCFVGLATDYCVKCSAVDALKYGYRVSVVTDAVKSIRPEEEALEDLKRRGINLVTTEEVKTLYS
jgi:nicotinamidase